MDRNEQTSAHADDEWRRADERRRTIDRRQAAAEERLRRVERRLGAGERRFQRIEQAIEHNTTLTKESLELLEMGRSCFRFFKNCGRVITWLRAVILGVAALWGLVFGHHGRPPDPPAH